MAEGAHNLRLVRRTNPNQKPDEVLDALGVQVRGDALEDPIGQVGAAQGADAIDSGGVTVSKRTVRSHARVRRG